MSLQDFSVEELMAEGFQIIKATLKTGENVTLVYSKAAFEKMANFTAEQAIPDFDSSFLLTCGLLGVTTAVPLLCPGCVTGPILSYMGFTAQGVKAGSMAATTQSFIGNVAKRSLFSILQSAGAGGFGGAIINNAVRWVSGAGAVKAASACMELWDLINPNATTGCWHFGEVFYCSSK